MPQFFNYPKLIVDELSKMGFEVDFVDDRPSANPIVKAVIRINRNLLNGYIEKYFDKIMQTVSNKEYDVVFLISGQSLSFNEEMIHRLKECQSKAKFLLYQWDSQTNFPYIKQFHKYFDKIFSFDQFDVASTNGLIFLPLFYSPSYEEIGRKKMDEFQYDFCFIGTAHPQKYKFIKMMSEQLRYVYPKQFIYFFFPSRLVFFYRKIHNIELKNARYREFHYVPLKEDEIERVYLNSRCILDSPQAGQCGLTIRVIEALGAKKKLITTNEDVINYDFYCPENIYVYKGYFDTKDSFFTEGKYKEIDKKIYEKYSLQCWLRKILE